MKLLITNAVICDSQSSWNGKKCNIWIANGLIEDIKPATSKNNPTKYKTIDLNGAFLMPGLVDLRCALREPGFEFKEDLASAANAALAGGFTTITALPDTKPTLQNKADMEFILAKSANLPIQILPYGAITKNREGLEMCELFDMKQAGAVAFTDANNAIANAGILLRALLYSKLFNGLLMVHAEDSHLSEGGRMHEGLVSVNLGLKGIPAMAEETIIARDIELAKYANAPIHFSHVSSKGSVDLIRKAKKQKQQVTCDVAVASLIYTDKNLENFDSNFKLTPPLRDANHQKALWDGLLDGTIDCIVTDHQPQDVEHKNVEFEYAASGMIMLQTALTALNQNKPQNIPLDVVVSKLTASPRAILNLPKVRVEKNEPAHFCVFDAKAQWQLTDKTNCSKSKNTPMFNQTLTGKVIYTFTKNNFHKF